MARGHSARGTDSPALVPVQAGSTARPPRSMWYRAWTRQTERSPPVAYSAGLAPPLLRPHPGQAIGILRCLPPERYALLADRASPGRLSAFRWQDRSGHRLCPPPGEPLPGPGQHSRRSSGLQRQRSLSCAACHAPHRVPYHVHLVYLDLDQPFGPLVPLQ